ncbi:hypothetical protein ACXX9E_29645 [Pseudomonas sp. GNP014]
MGLRAGGAGTKTSRWQVPPTGIAALVHRRPKVAVAKVVTLINKHGERFMERYVETAELLVVTWSLVRWSKN